MFYTKYRPQKFEDLVGLETVRNSLLRSLAKRRIGHAYLFWGPRGTGKTSAARILAKAVNCERIGKKGWRGEPCGECEACRAVAGGRFLDLIEIDAASNRGIDDIRNLREKIKLSPSCGRKKVYVIDEVHMLTKEACNALLKTLEEPPSHAVFVLCTTEPRKVPETVRSRCQIFEFHRARESDIEKKLKRICVEEGAGVGEEDLKKIAKAARGGFRDAETILEQVIVGGEAVDKLVGGLRGGGLVGFVDFLIAGDAESALTLLGHFYEAGGNIESFNCSLLEYLRDLLLIKVGVGDELVEAEEKDYRKMSEQGNSLVGDQLSYMINEFTQSLRTLAVSPIPTLPLELGVVNVCRLSDRAGLKSRRSSLGSCEDENCSGDAAFGKELKVVKERWGDILRTIRPYNHSLEALLRSVRPKSFDGRFLTLEVFYSFHRDKLSSAKNCSVVENAVAQILRVPVKVRCVLGKKRVKKAEKVTKKAAAEDLEKGAAGFFGEDLV